VVQIYCRDAADQVRQTQELEARTRDVGSDVDHISGYLVTNSSRYELHRTSFTRGDDDDDDDDDTDEDDEEKKMITMMMSRCLVTVAVTTTTMTMMKMVITLVISYSSLVA